LKTEYKDFLCQVKEILFGIFDYYANDPQTRLISQEPAKYRKNTLSVEAFAVFLKDFNAFGTETGLSKAMLKKIVALV